MSNGDERERFDPSLYGAPKEQPAEAESVTLEGRNVDLGPFGDPIRDPAATAMEMYEFARTGDAPMYETLEMAREGDPFPTEFPMAPGTSRASRELPEFFGSFRDIPESADAMQQMRELYADPEAGMFERMGAGMALTGPPGMPGGMRPAQEFQTSGMGAGLTRADALKFAAAGLTMYDPAEFAQVLLQVDENGERVYPQYSINQAPDGAFVVTNSINGAQAVINRPGMSMLDGAQMLTGMALFTPAGRMTAAMPSVMGRVAVGASTAAGTEGLIQVGHELAGGDFDTGDVVITGAIGPIVDLARPALGGIQRFGKYIGSYIPENLGEQIGLKTGISSVLPEAERMILNFSRRAKEFLSSNRPAIYMTEDALPEIHTPRIKILLKIAERMIFPGTGGLRRKQATQRVEVLRHLADRFNLDPATNYGAQVLDDINRAGTFDGVAEAIRNRARAVDDLGNVDIVLRDFRLKIRDLIADETRYGPMANQQLINLLNDARTAVWQGGVARPGPMPRDFGLMDDWLQRLRMHASDSTAPPQVRDALTSAADSLEADLRRHAGEAGDAGAQWIRSMDDAAAAARLAESRTLDALIEKGEIDEQVIRRIVRNADERQMQTLWDNLTPEGREAAQSQFLRNLFKVGGWRRGPAGEMRVDPFKVVQALETDAAEAQIRTFFPDVEDQEMFYGLIEYLKRTQGAARIGEGSGIAAAGGIKNIMKSVGANLANWFATAGLYGGAARLWQSSPMRNALLRLYHAGTGPRHQRNIDAAMNEITGILMASGQRLAQEEYSIQDPQDVVLMSGEAQDAMNEQSDFDLMMQTLRNITGQEEAQEQEASERLEQMQQEMNQ